MKKILIIILLVVLVLVSCSKEETKIVELPPPPSYVGLENSVVFEVGKVDFVVNKEATIPVTLRKYPDVLPASFQFDIFYDISTIEVLDVQGSNTLTNAGKQLQYNKLGNKFVRIVVAGMNNDYIEEGEVLTIKLKPLNKNPDFSIIKPVVSNVKGEIVDSSVRQ